MYGLIFDVDGVIGNTEPINARATAQVLAEMFDLQNVQPADFTAGLGRGAKNYILAATDVHGLTLTLQQLDQAAQAREAAILNMIRTEGLPTFPGVLELAAAAKAHPEFAVAIASSAHFDLVEAITDAVGLSRDNMVVITGDQVTHKKPDPQVFLLAAQGINVPPEQCVIVEDAPDGVAAAKAARATCIAVTNSVPADKLTAADRVVPSLAEINCETLKNLLA